MGKRLRRKVNPWLTGTVAGLATLAGGATLHALPLAPSPALERCAIFPEFSARYDNVLGTSMHLIVQAPTSRDAAVCERQILAEIARLSSILSTYDPASEISRVSNGASIESPELAEMLATYDLWHSRTNGVISANLADVKRLWTRAQRENRLPDPISLRRAFERPRAYNIDALGKGFIIDRAVAIARQYSTAGLLNIGGDIRAWGDVAWPIGIADPFDAADNAGPLAIFSLQNASVASSGGYERYFTLDGRKYSHIIDPRTLAPVDDIHRCATVVAPDCVTANALSTAMCVLDMPSVQPMAEQYGSGHLAVHVGEIHAGGSLARIALGSTDARERQSPDWHSVDGRVRANQEIGVPGAAESGSSKYLRTGVGTIPWNLVGSTRANLDAAASATATKRWAANFRVEINFTLILPTDRVKHPYVVVWVENEDGKPIRNITLWGNQDRYIPHLTTWWNLIHQNMKGAKSMAGATKPAGKYTLYWDGRNDAGTLQPQGKYKLHVEISREHGTHAEQIGEINCTADPDMATLEATAESEEGKLEYKRRGAK